MYNINVKLESSMLSATLDVFKDYFNNKYPCTTEDNDGSNMPVEDQLKWDTYNYLLFFYHNQIGKVDANDFDNIKKAAKNDFNLACDLYRGYVGNAEDKEERCRRIHQFRCG